ncbi:ribonuclease H-like domain-containing protein [Rhizophagus clarus]|uniref:Ribonuclease H-like domain-containing protein n=1 Tax=Rhizophagus clarus TaxID=94130 RepID=A0A8H3KUY9_9GLOM|nr:ribonuclease H-like domain-containing protein [Rhizophagus clarus]
MITTNKIRNIWNADSDQPRLYQTMVESYLDDTTWITNFFPWPTPFTPLQKSESIRTIIVYLLTIPNSPTNLKKKITHNHTIYIVNKNKEIMFLDQIITEDNDGSLCQPDTLTSLLDLGWLIPPSIISNVHFFVASKFFSSFTKGEFLALLTALLVYPSGASIQIFTDSRAVIYTLSRITSLLAK